MAGAPVGNNNATKGREFREALKRALAHRHETASNGLMEIAAKLVQAAEEGEGWAIKEIADRIDGKPAQSMMLGGDSENPLITRVERIIVNAANKDG